MRSSGFDERHPSAVTVTKSVMDELKRIIEDSEVTHEDDNNWPEPDRVGRQVGPRLRTGDAVRRN